MRLSPLRLWIASCHETRERLSAYLEDDLDPRTTRRLRRHLARCERCRAMLESLGRTLEHLRSLAGVEEVAPEPATVNAVIERIRRDER